MCANFELSYSSCKVQMSSCMIQESASATSTLKHHSLVQTLSTSRKYMQQQRMAFPQSHCSNNVLMKADRLHNHAQQCSYNVTGMLVTRMHTQIIQPKQAFFHLKQDSCNTLDDGRDTACLASAAMDNSVHSVIATVSFAWMDDAARVVFRLPGPEQFQCP